VYTFSLKDDNTTRNSMLKLVRMVQELKNDKNRDDSLLFSWRYVHEFIRTAA